MQHKWPWWKSCSTQLPVGYEWFIKLKQFLFVHYELHDIESTFIYPSNQGRTTSENDQELEEQAAVPLV